MTAQVDASGVTLALSRPPRRIVSLIPSITETLCHLGLADALVGVTVYCVEPRDVVRAKQRIGGEKDPDLEAIFARGNDDVAFTDFLRQLDSARLADDCLPCLDHQTLAERLETMAMKAGWQMTGAEGRR